MSFYRPIMKSDFTNLIDAKYEVHEEIREKVQNAGYDNIKAYIDKGLNKKEWQYLLSHFNFPEDYLEEIYSKIPTDLDSYKYLPGWVELRISCILTHQKLSEDFIERHMDEIKEYGCFGQLFTHQTLSESFIEKYAGNNPLTWENISRYQKLSDEFIDRHADDVDWTCISEYQTLSEETMLQHIDDIDWGYVSGSQEIPLHLLEAHMEDGNGIILDGLYWPDVFKFQDIPREFVVKHLDTFSMYSLIMEVLRDKYPGIEEEMNLEKKVLGFMYGTMMVKED